jgi:hypothetical protein
MEKEKRTIQGYEEIYSVRLGGGDIILAENPKAEDRYMVCDHSWDNPLGLDEYSNGTGSADYLEIMKEFINRLSGRVISLETERETRGIPLQTLTAADCEPGGMDTSLKDRVVVIKSDRLAPEYRSVDHQLTLCTGGFGAEPHTRGQSVFCRDLFSGKQVRWQRKDILGTVPYERLPGWARINSDALRKSAEKEAEIPILMDKNRFWQIIDAARKKAGRWQDMYLPLRDALAALNEPDIIRWKHIFNEYQTLSYKPKLWAAAWAMHNGCSDDGFEDFRGWLIAQGKEVFLKALANPDSLADSDAVRAFAREKAESEFEPSTGYIESADFEGMIYIASGAYENRPGYRGDDFYDRLDENALTEKEKADIAADIIYAPDIDAKWGGLDTPREKVWEEVKALCPKLYKAFHEPDSIETAPVGKESVLEKIRSDRKTTEKNKPKKEKSRKDRQEH